MVHDQSVQLSLIATYKTFPAARAYSTGHTSARSGSSGLSKQSILGYVLRIVEKVTGIFNAESAIFSPQHQQSTNGSRSDPEALSTLGSMTQSQALDRCRAFSRTCQGSALGARNLA